MARLQTMEQGYLFRVEISLGQIDRQIGHAIQENQMHNEYSESICFDWNVGFYVAWQQS